MGTFKTFLETKYKIQRSRSQISILVGRFLLPSEWALP